MSADIQERLARIETRLEDLREIKADVKEIEKQLVNLRIRVGTGAALVSFIVACLVQAFSGFFK